MEPGLRRLRHRARAPPSSPTRSSSRCGKRFGAGVTDVVLVVPGGYRTEQLGLLLGLAQECGMPVRALVDAAAAASVRPYPKRQLVYVDASLYRVSVTLLEQNGEAQVRAEHALAQGLAGARRCVRAPRRGSFRACDAFRSVRSRRDRAGAVRPLAGVARGAAREERVELSLKHRNEEFRVTAERDAVLGVRAGVLSRRRPAHRAAPRAGQAARRAAVRSRCGAAGVRRRALAARRLADRALCRRATPRAACCSRPSITASAGRREAAEARAVA